MYDIVIGNKINAINTVSKPVLFILELTTSTSLLFITGITNIFIHLTSPPFSFEMSKKVLQGVLQKSISNLKGLYPQKSSNINKQNNN